MAIKISAKSFWNLSVSSLGYEDLSAPQGDMFRNLLTSHFFREEINIQITLGLFFDADVVAVERPTVQFQSCSPVMNNNCNAFLLA